jgi:hypothetical protein
MHERYWWESQRERDHWEDQNIGGWAIVKWHGMDWIDLAQDRDQWNAVVNTVTNFLVP